MLIHGFAPAARLPDDTAADRFWYWRGASGRTYIHSIYQADDCPPLPGAVYVAVRRLGKFRIAVAAGRFPAYWEGGWTGGPPALAAQSGADEIHVHLLARNEAGAEAVRRDLELALAADAPPAARGADPQSTFAAAA